MSLVCVLVVPWTAADKVLVIWRVKRIIFKYVVYKEIVLYFFSKNLTELTRDKPKSDNWVV